MLVQTPGEIYFFFYRTFLDAADRPTTVVSDSRNSFCALTVELCMRFQYSPSIMVLSTWCLLHITWELVLLLIHLTLAFRNLTTNELLKRSRYIPFEKSTTAQEGTIPPIPVGRSYPNSLSEYSAEQIRYHNPFDRGCTRNFFHFLTGKPLFGPDEWYTLYELPLRIEESQVQSMIT